MKNKKIFVAVLIIIMTCCIFILAGCANDNYDTKGVAKVNITFDKEYQGVEISCPEADVTKTDSMHFSLALKNRKQIKILISCEGYQAKILSYSTKQLSEEINETVTLDTRRFIFSTTIAGVEKLDEVKIVDKSINAASDNIESIKIEKSKIVVTSKLPLTKISVEAEGYKTLNFDVPKYNAKYMLDTSLMLMSTQNTTQVCVMIVNDTGTTSVSFSDTVYNDIDENINMSDGNNNVKPMGCVALNNNKNYKVRASYSNGEMYLTAKELQSSNGYFILNTSSIKDSQNNDILRATDWWEVKNLESPGNQYFYAKNVVSYPNHDQINSRYVCAFPESLVVGDTIMMSFYIDGVYTYKKHILTSTDVEKKSIDCNAFDVVQVETLAPKFKFVDENGDLITKEIIVSGRINYETVTESISNGIFVLNGKKWWSEYIESLSIEVNGDDKYNQESISVHNNICNTEDKTIILKKKEKVKVKLSYGDNSNEIVVDAENGYFTFDNCLNDYEILVFANYSSTGRYKLIDGLRTDNLSISFSKKLASYNDSEDCYYMEVKLQQEFIVEVTISNFDEIQNDLLYFRDNVFITIGNRDFGYYVEENNKWPSNDGIQSFQQVFKLKIYDNCIGKTLKFVCRTNSNEYYAAAEGNYKIKLDDLKSGAIQLEVSVEVIHNSNNK